MNKIYESCVLQLDSYQILPFILKISSLLDNNVSNKFISDDIFNQLLCTSLKSHNESIICQGQGLRIGLVIFSNDLDNDMTILKESLQMMQKYYDSMNMKFSDASPLARMSYSIVSNSSQHGSNTVIPLQTSILHMLPVSNELENYNDIQNFYIQQMKLSIDNEERQAIVLYVDTILQIAKYHLEKSLQLQIQLNLKQNDEIPVSTEAMIRKIIDFAPPSSKSSHYKFHKSIKVINPLKVSIDYHKEFLQDNNCIWCIHLENMSTLHEVIINNIDILMHLSVSTKKLNIDNTKDDDGENNFEYSFESNDILVDNSFSHEIGSYLFATPILANERSVKSLFPIVISPGESYCFVYRIQTNDTSALENQDNILDLLRQSCVTPVTIWWNCKEVNVSTDNSVIYSSGMCFDNNLPSHHRVYWSTESIACTF